ncbi:VOC family protein [Nocardia uniformis]|uniref:VOC family protein n=1 Tax=Nocardia uniformis TaxID=53432 RepID=A0A849C4G5_9NOCA|nr:VOC family protein [Nocardia uniformis]NNH71235.1 VOC family protein [Nocardia uniformis]
MTTTGTITSLAFWAQDGKALAAFYAAALGWELGPAYPDESGTPIAFTVTDGTTACIFYSAHDFKAPRWPEEQLPFHFNLAFPDPAAAEERLLELGATKPEHQPGQGHWTVLLDPSGQPFCVSEPPNT